MLGIWSQAEAVLGVASTAHLRRGEDLMREANNKLG